MEAEFTPDEEDPPGMIGVGARPVDEDDPWSSRATERSAVLDGLDRAAAGDQPTTGPRGGKIWTPRRFLRRVVWHVLDHAWEIEDRSGS